MKLSLIPLFLFITFISPAQSLEDALQTIQENLPKCEETKTLHFHSPDDKQITRLQHFGYKGSYLAKEGKYQIERFSPDGANSLTYTFGFDYFDQEETKIEEYRTILHEESHTFYRLDLFSKDVNSTVALKNSHSGNMAQTLGLSIISPNKEVLVKLQDAFKMAAQAKGI